MIFSAMAIHWIKPDVAFIKSATLLKPSGHLVLMEIDRQLPAPVEKQLEKIYQRYSDDFKAIEQMGEGLHPQKIQLLSEWSFNEKEKVESQVNVHYNAHQYLGLMKTMSDHRTLPVAIQEQLFLELQKIFDQHGPVECKIIMKARILQKK